MCVPFIYASYSIALLQEIDSSEYETLEALVSRVADVTLAVTGQVEYVTVRGGKPNALACAEAAEVEIRRDPTVLRKKAPVVLTDPLQISFGQYYRKPQGSSLILPSRQHASCRCSARIQFRRSLRQY